MKVEGNLEDVPLHVFYMYSTAECITGKSYAKHDVMSKEEADQNFVDMIKEQSTKGPKDQSEHPVTENQR